MKFFKVTFICINQLSKVYLKSLKSVNIAFLLILSRFLLYIEKIKICFQPYFLRKDERNRTSEVKNKF
ncbi:MAG: hypothetical protein SPG48_07515 [Treponema sp.]|nr:hypothetical protein [Treponema sp.]